MKEIIQRAMANLAEKEMIFCSEGGFQYHLANEIKELGKGNLEIFLEYRRVDICVYDKKNNKKYFIELKYKTSKLDCERNGMKYSLRNHGAQNDGRHAFFKDINKLEKIEEKKLECSFALFLTNDHLYWDGGAEGVGEKFCIMNNQKIECDDYEYKNTKNKSETSTTPIKINHIYECNWEDYLTKTTDFKYLLLQIPPEEKNKN